jgi:hypothetical protein
MFNKEQDYSKQNRSPIAVALTLASGDTMHGTLMIPISRTLADELNRGEPFIEFEPYSGQKTYIARVAIASVKELNFPRSDQLTRKLGQLDQFDPHAILGVRRDADALQIRSAYLALAKVYHPDRFAKLELPKEVADYLSAVATRINLAYSELRSRVEPAPQPGSQHAGAAA